jgi:hypothetical protein
VSGNDGERLDGHEDAAAASPPSPSVLIDVLGRTPAVLAFALDQVPADRYDRRRFEDRWSVTECVAHLVAAQQVLIDRFVRFEREDDPRIADYEPPPPSDPRYRGEDLDDLQARFAEIRARTVTRLEGYDEGYWLRTGRHESFDPYGTKILLGHALHVDYAHLLQIERAGLAIVDSAT